MIRQYIEYIALLSDASEEYSKAVALGLMSGIVQRNVEIPALMSKTLYPNVWVMVLGHSGLSRKSTVIQPAREIILDTNRDTLLPDQMTEESTFAFFNERGSSQGVLVVDEFAGALANMDKEYSKGLKQLYMKLYDCVKYERRKLKNSDEVIQDAYLTIIGGGTPNGVTKYLSEKDIESGFIPRFIIVYPELPPPKRIKKRTAEALMRYRRIGAEAFLLGRLLDNNRITVEYDTEAFNHIADIFYSREQEIRKDYNLIEGSVYARNQEYAFKVSTLFAIDDLLEKAGDITLDALSRDIVYIPPREQKDDDVPPSTEMGLTGYLMYFMDNHNTAEALGEALARFILEIGDSLIPKYGQDLKDMPKKYKPFMIIYSEIKRVGPENAMKAGVLGALDEIEIPVRVTLEHVERAMKYLDRREEDMKRVMIAVIGGQYRQVVEKIYKYLEKHGMTSHSTLLKNLHMNRKELAEAIQQLVEEDRVTVNQAGKQKVYSIRK